MNLILRKILSFKWGGPKTQPDSILGMGAEMKGLMNQRIDNVKTANTPSFQPATATLEPEPARAGLQIKWMVGERMPWKGIWFTVTQVEPGYLMMVPERATWKRVKALKESGAR